MFTLDFVINPVILFIAGIGGALLGFIIGSVKLAKSRAKVVELEREMMDSHAEILELQRSYVQLENQLQQQSIPVIPMKISGKENNSNKEKATK
ncbi:MAG TPA: hypothetical protein VGM31_20975 [Puia sp.]|jgi:hypothetical protein